MKFSSSVPQDCVDLAPQLTALFDGEADEVMAKPARAHLLSCPACSRQWLDWTRYRDTLQTEPVPAPPPTLLWRVLISYRVAAIARPARRRSSLPQLSATILREIEAPLPPRLSQHILARTTRKPSVHVMLTPLNGPAPRAKSRFKGRAFSFRHAPLWAAPALALWILLLGRADFNATLPVATSDSSFVIDSASPQSRANADSSQTFAATASAPIPVSSAVADFAQNEPRPTAATGAVAAREVSLPRSIVALRAEARAQPSDVRSPGETFAAPVARPVSLRSNRSDAEMDDVLLMALNAGRRDMMRTRVSSRSVAAAPIPIAAPVAQISAATPAPRTEPAATARQIIPIAPAAKAAPRRRFGAPENTATARVTLAALASPISPIRVVSVARVRTAAFSEDSLRPRVAHLSADGRRLARALPDEGAIPLRVSRPNAGAPVGREISFNNGDNGPKLDELRSAVDDFRASVAGDQ